MSVSKKGSEAGSAQEREEADRAWRGWQETVGSVLGSWAAH